MQLQLPQPQLEQAEPTCAQTQYLQKCLPWFAPQNQSAQPNPKNPVNPTWQCSFSWSETVRLAISVFGCGSELFSPAFGPVTKDRSPGLYNSRGWHKARGVAMDWVTRRFN